MNVLVGYTGFVGNNLYATGNFGAVYNSKNIKDAYGTKPELLIYAGLRAEKYLANNAPEKDMELIIQAEENIRKIAPKKLVLISTVDVFKEPNGVDESSRIETEGLHPYGYNRYQLELWAREMYEDALIVRLTGLFGKKIKKNFIYDYINRIPFMLRQDVIEELSRKDSNIGQYYNRQDNGFYRLQDISSNERENLKKKFEELGFSALNFTDSRSKYQFYNLEYLWNDICIALKEKIKVWHTATEPISSGELYLFLEGKIFSNELEGVPMNYDCKTLYADMFGGKDGYICRKDRILEEIRKFVKGF